jgi:hypothetical protein
MVISIHGRERHASQASLELSRRKGLDPAVCVTISFWVSCQIQQAQKPHFGSSNPNLGVFAELDVRLEDASRLDALWWRQEPGYDLDDGDVCGCGAGGD